MHGNKKRNFSEYFDNEEGPNPEELVKIGADIQKLIKQQEDEELNGQLEQQPAAEEQLKSEPKAADQQKRGQFEVNSPICNKILMTFV